MGGNRRFRNPLAVAAHIARALAVQSGYHGTSLLAAALAFFALFSLFPLLLLLVAVAGYVLSPAVVERDIVQLAGAYAPSVEGLVRANLTRMMQLRASLGVVGLVALVWAGSNVFAVLSTTVNRIWDVRQPREFWLRRAIGLLMVLGAGTVLAGSLAAAALAHALSGYAAQFWGPAGVAGARALDALSGVVLPAATFAIVGLSYRYVPMCDPRPGWAPVLLSALLATATMQAARYGFAWYVSTLGAYEVLYGGLTAFVVFALWVYVVSWLYLYGAELTAILETMRGE